MVKNCSPNVPPSRIANDIDRSAEEMSDIEARNLRRLNRLRNFGEYAPDKEAGRHVEELLTEQNIWMNNVAQAGFLNPNKARGIGAMLAREFGIEHGLLGKLTDAGGVRRTVRNMFTTADAKVASTLGKIETIRQIRHSADAFRQFARRATMDPGIQAELWDKAVYLGQTERILSMTKGGPAARRFLEAEHGRFVEKLMGMGLDNKQINSMLLHAKDVSNIYDEAFQTMMDAGVSLKPEEMFAYMSNVLSQDAKFHIGRKLQAGMTKSESPTRMIQNLLRSRETKEFISEDEVLLAYVLNKPVEEVRKAILDDNVLTREFVEMQGEHLDWLVDQGIISKMPMPSRRVADVLIKRYNLPYRGLNEVFATDPVRGYNQYVAKLSNDFGESRVASGIAKEGLTNGWAVPGSVAREGGEYADFVKLSEAGIGKGVADADLFVHPFVAESYRAMVDINTTPAKIGSFSQLVYYLSRTARTMMLSTGNYVMHNLYGNFINYYMAHGNLLSLIPSFGEVLALHGGFKVLDNTRKAYLGGKATARELWEMGVQAGILNPASNFERDLLSGGRDVYKAWNPKNLPRALGYLVHAFKTHGVIPGLAYSGRLVSDFVSSVTYPIMWSANYLDTAYKWSLLKSIVDDGVGSAIPFLTNGKVKNFKNFDKAAQWIEDYFPNFAQVGKTDSRIARYVMPFWVWTSRNIPNQIRNAIRHPGLFLGYMKIQAILNYPAEQAGSDLPEGGVPEWLLHNRPIYWKDAGGHWFALGTTNFDPIGVALQTGIDSANQAGRFMGLYLGTEKEKRDKMEGKDTQNFLAGLIQNTYPLFKSAVAAGEILSGKDVSQFDSSLASPFPLAGNRFENAKPTTFLGIKMHPFTRFLLETNVPSAGYLNRIMNPNLTPEESAVRNLGGLTITKINVAKQMGYTETDIYYSIKELKAGAKQLKVQLKHAKTPEQAKAIAQNLAQVNHHIGVLNYDMNNIKHWERKRGIPDYKTRAKYKKKGIDITERVNTNTHKIEPAINNKGPY